VRAVIDTNVLVSGTLWRGPPHRLIDHVRRGNLIFVSSPALLAELADVVSRPKFQSILARSKVEPRRLLSELRRLAEIVEPPAAMRVSRDPDDDIVLALAIAANADLIVTGDGDLLALGSYRDIPIVTPSAALARIRR
jgi:putative PIN family toxin of toxin-antitoxin system